MNLIEVKSTTTGAPALINLDLIVAIIPWNNGCRLCEQGSGEDFWEVEESYEEIERKLGGYVH